MKTLTALPSILVLSLAMQVGCSDIIPTDTSTPTANTYRVIYTKYDWARANTDIPELLMVDTAGKNLQDLGMGFATGTAGNEILYAIANTSNKASLLLISDNRGAFHVIYTPDTVHILQQYPKLAADGGRVVFTVRDTGAQDRYHVMIVDADGKNLHSVCDDASHETEPGISPDGEYVAYYQATSTDTSLVVARSDGSAANKIVKISDPMVDYAGEAEWSPDGFRLAYTDNGHVYVIDRDGSNRVDVGEGLSPRWRPGANSILMFVRDPGDFQWDIMVADGLFKNVVNITNTNAQWELTPEWSQDGRYIVCSTGTGEPDHSTSSTKLIEVATGATKLLGTPGTMPFFTH